MNLFDMGKLRIALSLLVPAIVVAVFFIQGNMGPQDVQTVVYATLTIQNVELDDFLQCNPDCNHRPEDYAYILIQNISVYGVENTTIPFNSSTTYKLKSLYGVRGGIQVTHPMNSSVAPDIYMDNGKLYFVKKSILVDTPEETVYPALEPGMKLNARILYSHYTHTFVELTEYKII